MLKADLHKDGWAEPLDDGYPPDHTVMVPCDLIEVWSDMSHVPEGEFMITVTTEDIVPPHYVVIIGCKTHKGEALGIVDLEDRVLGSERHRLRTMHQKKFVSEPMADLIAWERGEL